jgi:hypothetical protein
LIAAMGRDVRRHPPARPVPDRRGPVARRLVLVLLLCAVCPAGARAQPAPDEPIVARVTIADPADLARFLGLGLDVLETREGSDLFVLTTAAELDRLRADGWTIRIDADRTLRLRQQQQQQRQRSAPAPPQTQLFVGGYRTVSEIRDFLEDRATRYPDLAELIVYGESWERVMGGPLAGHDLLALRLANRQRTDARPTLFVMATIHAREIATAELAMQLVDHLLAGYGADADATWLLDEHTIVVVPLVNPDGRVLADQGYLQRKNTDTSHGSCGIPSIGVDLNRNAGFKWGTVDRPTLSPCAQT